MPTSPAPISLASDRYRITIDHTKGMSIHHAHFNHPRQGWLPIISRNVPGEDPATSPASFLMAPWVNRIRAATFSFNGQPITLRPDPREGHAMHGDLRKRPWHLLDRTPVSVRAIFRSSEHPDFNWPASWPIEVTCRFEIDEVSITQEITLTSRAKSPIPAGMGIHPYFPRQQRPGPTEAHIYLPHLKRFPHERCMPIAPAARDSLCKRLDTLAPLAPGYVMDSLVGHKGVAFIRWQDCDLVMHSTNSPHIVLFAPTEPSGFVAPFFAIEPQTIAANGFNMLAQGQHNHGVTILQPGESLTTTHRFTATPR